MLVVTVISMCKNRRGEEMGAEGEEGRDGGVKYGNNTRKNIAKHTLDSL